MALDLLSEKGLHGKIPRRYRHEAESFSWSLLCIYHATAVSKNDKNFTVTPHPVREWFRNMERSRCDRVAYRWNLRDHPKVQMAYPNAKYLACSLHSHWMDRYNQELYGRDEVAEDDDPDSEDKVLMRMFDCKLPPPYPPYKELDDDYLFRKLLWIYKREAGGLGTIKGVLVELAKRYSQELRAI